MGIYEGRWLGHVLHEDGSECDDGSNWLADVGNDSVCIANMVQLAIADAKDGAEEDGSNAKRMARLASQG